MVDHAGRKKHILVVDDERNLSQMLCMLLQTRGYAVDIAATAKESLEKVLSSEFDLIILDLILPDLDGFEVCRRLKESKKTAHIPIIMVSAHSLYEDKVEALYLGADDFVAKPCEHEELFARMEAVMRRGNGSGKENIDKRKAIISELRRILDHALVTPHFQPIYLFEPFRLFGMEILTRPKTTGLLSNPESFFRAALQFGLYTEMEIMAWSMAISQLSKHIRDEKIFLNCNPYFIEASQFARVKAIFEKNGIPFQNVVLEITERSAISDFKLFYKQLDRYRELGFCFAVDDVGGGYASLESIVETKPEVVKIDGHIVQGLNKDPFKRSIVKFIVSLCQENGIISVAEGIETKEEYDIVRSLGINAGQGYYLYKPTPEVSLPEFSGISLK